MPLRARTQRAILDAAALTFRQEGFDGTSMDAIAEQAGVGRATLYYHFASKDAIAVAIAERFRATGYEKLLNLQDNGADALTLIKDFFVFAGEWIAENRDVAFVGTVAALKGVGREPDRPGTTLIFEKLVIQGQHEGVFRTDLEARDAARLLVAVLNQAALVDTQPAASNISARLSDLLDVAMNALLSGGGLLQIQQKFRRANGSESSI